MKRKKAIRSISLPAPAKVNLCLSVIGSRPDGFHELVTLMAKIDLCDLVTLERTETKGEISCICDGPDGLVVTKTWLGRPLNYGDRQPGTTLVCESP